MSFFLTGLFIEPSDKKKLNIIQSLNLYYFSCVQDFFVMYCLNK